jgi:hypothetical protein
MFFTKKEQPKSTPYQCAQRCRDAIRNAVAEAQAGRVSRQELASILMNAADQLLVIDSTMGAVR